MMGILDLLRPNVNNEKNVCTMYSSCQWLHEPKVNGQKAELKSLNAEDNFNRMAI